MTATSDVLRYLADVADQSAPARSSSAVRRSGDIAHLGWLGLVNAVDPRSTPPPHAKATDELRRLERLDRLHAEEHLLRLGWLWVSGRAERDGAAPETVLLPLVVAPVELRGLGPLRRFAVATLDDLAVNPMLVTQRDLREPLDDALPDVLRKLEWMEMNATLLRRFPTFLRWAGDVLAAAGLTMPPLTEPDVDPWTRRNDAAPVLVPGAAVYLSRDLDQPNVADDLRTWAGLDTSDTAFAVVYTEREISLEAGPRDHVIESAYPLNEAQRRAMIHARTAPVTVVAGPPGTGKSHTVAALAVDEVARGASVLVATQSEYAADVVAELLGRHPGPQFVRFGSREQRREVADDVSSGMAQPLDDDELRRLIERRDAVAERLAASRRRLTRALDTEAAFVEGLATRTRLAAVAVDAPGAVDPATPWDDVEGLWQRRDATSWWGRRRWRRALPRLRKLLGMGSSGDVAVVEDAVTLGRAERAVTRALAAGGTRLGPEWHELAEAEREWRKANGAVIEAIRRSSRHRRRTSAQAVAALATALRSGRAARRRTLRELDPDEFLDVLPLWVGTLGEIDDALPLRPGVFDVVVFDEAGQIDQMRAAPALARASRAVVVGDPRQLRHVSFVADDTMVDAARRRLGGARPTMLDVRRNSLFDAAAGAAQVIELDEHFRSVPHIIGFSDRAFYAGRLNLMTQHPATETLDAIQVRKVPGERDAGGVHRGQVAAVLEELRGMNGRGASVGVISPFRAQADAIEEAVLDSFDEDEIVGLGLRVGTVHAFQGNERDVVVISLGLGDGDLTGSLRFVEDPNLFNVMVTRARRGVVVLTSHDLDELPRGLLRRYLRHADRPPTPAEAAAPPRGWIAALAARIADHGVRVVAGYPVAGQTVDLAVGEGPAAFGVECVVHPAGPHAHIERHRALLRAGWQLTDAFESRWLVDPEGAVAALVERVLRSEARSLE